MVAAQTIPISASAASNPDKLWTPDHRDQLVYEWVTLQGKTQSEVAHMLKLSQPTVSRIVQRYRRWLGHAGPGVDGSLASDERRAVQRRLTYERNEWLLAGAMRLARDLEGFTDATQSTVRTRKDQPAAKDDVTTVYKSIDRSGEVCRFLRLAFRINMEQLRLVEQDSAEPLKPLTIADMRAWEAAQALWAEDEMQSAEGGMRKDRATAFSREQTCSRSAASEESTPGSPGPGLVPAEEQSCFESGVDDDPPLPPQDEIDAALDRLEAGAGTDADHALLARLERDAARAIAECELGNGDGDEAADESLSREQTCSRSAGEEIAEGGLRNADSGSEDEVAYAPHATPAIDDSPRPMVAAVEDRGAGVPPAAQRGAGVPPAVAVHTVNKMNNAPPPQSTTNAFPPTPCASEAPAAKNFASMHSGPPSLSIAPCAPA
jgi:transposase